MIFLRQSIYCSSLHSARLKTQANRPKPKNQSQQTMEPFLVGRDIQLADGHRADVLPHLPQAAGRHGHGLAQERPVPRAGLPLPL